MMKWIKCTAEIFKTAIIRFIDKEPIRLSATVSYYAIFSLPALLVILIWLTSLIFGHELASGQIFDVIRDFMGKQTAQRIQSIVEKTGQIEASIWSTIVGLLVLVYGATGAFTEVQKTLNSIWGVDLRKDNKGFFLFFKRRLFSLGLIIAFGLLVLVSMVLDAVLIAMTDFLKDQVSGLVIYVYHLINFGISLGFTATLFALIYKFVPATPIRWPYIWTGAVSASVLFTAGKFLLSFYFTQAQPGSNYGAAGAMILVLIWVSYSSMIIYLGAEVTKASSDQFHDPNSLK